MKRIDLSYLVNDKTFTRQLKPIRFGTYDQCEQLFEDAFLLSDQTVKDFNMLPEYVEIINWLVNTEGKGILMTGSNGRGKSTILMGVLPLIFLHFGKVLSPVSAQDLDIDNLKWAIGIDEIGQDSIKNDYGTKTDAVEYAISHCENRMKLLLMTSNLTEEQIIQRYGIRIMDRINRLCKIVVFKGKSFRK